MSIEFDFSTLRKQKKVEPTEQPTEQPPLKPISQEDDPESSGGIQFDFSTLRKQKGSKPAPIPINPPQKPVVKQEDVQKGLEQSPAEAKKILMLHEKTGIPLEQIRKDPEAAQKVLDNKLWELQALSRDYSLTYDALGKSPELVASYKGKDSPLLFERIKKGSRLNFDIYSVLMGRYKDHNERELWGGKLSNEEQAELSEDQDMINALGEQKEAMNLKWYEKFPVETAGQVPTLWELGKGAGATGVAGAGLGAVAGLAIKRSPMGLWIGGKAGLSLGLKGGFIVGAGRMEAALAYGEFKGLKDPDGNPILQNNARGMAMAVGAANMVLETIGGRLLLRLVPGGDRLIKTAVIDKMMKSPVLRNQFAKYGANIALTGGGEAFVEGLQELSVNLGQEILELGGEDLFITAEMPRGAGPAGGIGMKATESMGINPVKLRQVIAEVDWGRVLKAGAAGGYVGTTFGVVASPVKQAVDIEVEKSREKKLVEARQRIEGAVQVLEQTEDNKQAFQQTETQNAEEYQKSGDAIVASKRLYDLQPVAEKLVKEAPTEKVGKEILRNYADSDAVYFMDPEMFKEVAKEAGMSSEELAQVVFEGDVASFHNAFLNGQEIMIPETSYFQNILASALNEKFVPHLRLDLDANTQKEGVDTLSERQKQFNAILEEKGKEKEAKAKDRAKGEKKSLKEKITSKFKKGVTKTKPKTQNPVRSVGGDLWSALSDLEAHKIDIDLADEINKLTVQEKKDIDNKVADAKEKSKFYQSKLNMAKEKAVQEVIKGLGKYYPLLRDGKVKLNRGMLLDVIGGDIYEAKQKMWDSISVEDGGMDLDSAVLELGYHGPGTMIGELMENPYFKPEVAQVAAKIAEKRTDKKFGGNIRNRVKHEVVKIQVEKINYAVRRIIEKVKEARPDLPFPSQKRIHKLIDKHIEEHINLYPIKMVFPERYRNSARDNSHSAAQAVKDGRFSDAVNFYTQQLINNTLYMETLEFKTKFDEQVGLLENLLRNIKDKQYLENNKYAHREHAVLKSILDRFNLGRSTETEFVDVQAWYNDMIDSGYAIVLPDLLLDDNFTMDYRDLNYGQFQGLVQSIRQIQHIARIKNQFLTAGKSISMEKASSDVAAQIATNKGKPKEVKEDIFAKTQLSALGQWIVDFAYGLDRPEFIFEAWQNEQFKGVITEHLWTPLIKAKEAKDARMKVIAEKLDSILTEKLTKEWHKPLVKKSLAGKLKEKATFWRNDINSKEQLISLMLNWGNVDNRKRVLESFDITEEQLKEFFREHTTLEDRQAVNGIWKVFEDNWQDVKALDLKTKGVAPTRKELTPFSVGKTKMTGGYYPIMYSFDSVTPNFSFDVDKFDITEKAKWNANIMTDDGHTKEVTLSGGNKLRTDLGVIFSGLDQIAHDLTHREAVIDIANILRDGRVKQAIVDVSNNGRYRSLIKWLTNVANESRAGEKTLLGTGTDHIRQMLTVNYMGLKASVGLVQFTGLTVSANEIGANYIAKGTQIYQKMVADGKEDDIFEMSPFLENRAKMGGAEREFREALKRGRISGWNKGMFWMIVQADMFVSKITWLGAVQKYKDGLIAGVNPLDDNQSFLYADSVVRKTQGASDILNLGHVQAGNALERAVTMFYTYFNVVYNQAKKSMRLAGKEDELSQKAMKYATSYMYLILIPSIMDKYLRDGMPEDEAGAWTKWVLSANTEQFIGQFPVFRNIAGRWIKGYGTEASPVFSSFEVVGRLGDKLKSSESVKDFFGDKKGHEAILGGIGLAKPIPVRQTINFIRALQEAMKRDSKGGSEKTNRVVETFIRGRVRSDEGKTKGGGL